MTYQAGGLIQASDYANFIGSGATANTLNAVWSTGSSSAGYGQTALSGVSSGARVQASEWANLVNTTASAASHQGTTITSVTAPTSGGSVSVLSAIPTNLQTIYTNRLNAASQGTTTANIYTIGSLWSNSFTIIHSVSFANGDASRYFFNAGGQIKMTYTHSSTAAGINLEYYQLAMAIGTVVLSSPSSGTISVAGGSFNGITKVGGSGTPTILSTNLGYYGLTNTNQSLFQQIEDGGVYGGAHITLSGRTTGSNGSNQGNGNIVVLTSSWDTIPDPSGGPGRIVAAGSTTTCTVVYPSSSILANTWGSVIITSTGSGS